MEDRPDSVNPYQPPSSDVNATVPAPPAAGPLARRLTRFVAYVVDALLYWLALLPAWLVALRGGAFREGSMVAVFRAFFHGPLGALSGIAWLALFALQAYLVATTGQSIAKRLFAIRIVRTDGRPVSFVSGVLLRSWLPLLLQQFPVVKVVLPLVDALFIFREDRRCLHDLVADTKVIDVSNPPSAP